MNKKVVHSIVSYIVYGVIGLVLFLVAFLLRKPWEYEEAVIIMRYLSDCFIVPGVILMCLYALQIITRLGGFDGLSYGVRFVVQQFLPTGAMNKMNYYEYKQAKIEKRKDVHMEGLLIGSGFLFIGLIFFVVYYLL